MSIDRSIARCSFCGQRPPAIRRMVAGPGAAYICDECLELCNEIMSDPTPFSAKALELASRPPVVIAAPEALVRPPTTAIPQKPHATVTLDFERKQNGETLMLHQLQFFVEHFELHYLWIRAPFQAGFSFVPRIIFLLTDSEGTRWAGERGGMLFERSELSSDPEQAIYQGYARFSPLPAPGAQRLVIRAIDPLGPFEHPAPLPWEFRVEF